MNMHRTHRYAHGILKRERDISRRRRGGDHHINFQELLYRTAGKTQKDPFVQRVFLPDFTVNYVGKTVFIYPIQTQTEALENYQMNIQLNLQ